MANDHQQHNRPQSNQGQQTKPAQPVMQVQPPIETSQIPSQTSNTQEQDARPETKLTMSLEVSDLKVHKETFEELLSDLIQHLVTGSVTSHEAKAVILEWIKENPEFTREEATEVAIRLRGSLEVVTNEIPRMFVR